MTANISTTTDKLDLEQGSSKARVHDIAFSKVPHAVTTIHIAPGDVLNFHGWNLDAISVGIVGRDLVIIDSETDQKVVFPELGLFLFSERDAPRISFDGTVVSGNDLLTHVGQVADISEADFVSFANLEMVHTGGAADKLTGDQAGMVAAANAKAAEAQASAAKAVQSAEAKVAVAESVAAAALMQVVSLTANAPAKPQEATDPDLQGPKADPLLVARQSLLSDSEGVPEQLMLSARHSPPPSSGSSHTSDYETGGSFNFAAALLQVSAVDETSLASHTYYGGNGSSASTLDASSGAQFSTQIIDQSANNNALTIYASNPNYFTSAEMSRVISISPYLPDGFAVKTMTISGLPTGYSIDGAVAGDGNSYTISDPSTFSGDKINLLLKYPNAEQTPFTILVLVTSEFDPTSGFSIPAFNEFTIAVTKTTQTIDVTSSAGYNYTDSLGNAGWVLSTTPNAAKIMVGNGNDTIYGSDGGTIVIAGNGSNLIYGGQGNDSITVGSGNNTFVGSHGADTISAGSGTNTISYLNLTTDMTIDLSTVNGGGFATANKGNSEIDLLKGVNNISLGDGNNSVTGNASNNALLGGAGDDTIHASLGNDTLDGGSGTNTIDFATAGAGLNIDLTTGTATGWGNDTLSNFQIVHGSNHGDTITGSTGNDNVVGGSGNNLIYATLGDDTVDGGVGGTNTLSFVHATSAVVIDLVTGAATGWGNDTITNIQNINASDFGDTITGNGHNVIVGGAGDDLISAGGNSTVYASLGNDSLDGGTGINTINFSTAANSVTIDLAAGTAWGWGNDTLTNFQSVVGSNHGDTITGSSGDDSIIGGSGNNYFYITTGGDTLNGGIGGFNTIDLTVATSSVNINMMTGVTSGFATDTVSNFTTILGSNFGDTITGSAGSDSIRGGDGDNLIFATRGSDTLDGGVGGTNTISFANADVSSNINLTTGTTTGWATDTFSNFMNVMGSNVGDTITSGAGDESITGGSGNDLFFATVGTDTFVGGSGTDALSFISVGSAVTLHLDTGVSSYGANTVAFSEVERFIGSNNGDTIYGSTGSDSVLGGSGSNLFYASLGSDTLDGGVGGTNTITFANATSASVINLTTGITTGWATDTLSNFTHVIGSDFGDTIKGSAGSDSITGGSGNNFVYATTGVDTINGGVGGTNTISFENATTASTINLATGATTGWATDALSNFSRLIGSNIGDTITGSAASDNITAGSGNDFVFATTGSDTISGGGGTNTISFANATTASTINLTTGATTGWATDALSDFSRLIGSNIGDTITGSAESDNIAAGSGNDIVYVTAGSDTISGGGGTNTLSFSTATSASNVDLTAGTSTGFATDILSNFTVVIGSNHGDTIRGTAGSDNVTGGAGNDILIATIGSDTINGGGGLNTISFANATSASTINLATGVTTGWAMDALSNISRVTGSNYGDTITGSAGANTITGGSGSDLFFASAGNDSYVGGGGTDTLSFANIAGTVTLHLDTSSSVDSLGSTAVFNGVSRFIGSDNGDTIYGSGGNDSVLGGAGDNFFYASLGNDTLNGGAGGTNALSFQNAASAVNVNLTTGLSSGWGNDTLSNFHVLIGSDQGDTITGSTGDDSITGGAGDNLFYASLGSDTLNGGAGGTNTLSFANATSSSTINLTTGATSGWATDTISNFTKVAGSNFGDTITGSAGSDSLTGGTGNNLFYATTGSDTIDGGVGGTNTISFLNATSASTINLTTGATTGWATDTLSNLKRVVGSNYGDTITGSAGNNLITGGTGGDRFNATAGMDTYVGGGGTDTLSFAGMAVAQTLHLDTSSSSDVSGNSSSFSGVSRFVGSNRGDTIYGSTGNDSVLGGSGSNFFYASLGSDTLNGGVGGTNTISFVEATSASTINLATGTTTGWATDTVSNFSKVVTSAYGDTVIGGTGNNSITGGTGNDLFYASAGSDIYVGGGGTDTLSFANRTIAQSLHLDTSSASDASGSSASFTGITSFIGSNYGDTVHGSTGNDSVLGGSGDNLFYASLGSDTLNGGVGGTNTISFVNATSASMINLTTGTTTGWATDALSNFSRVIGSSRGDTITGSGGSENITGGSGNDLFYATAGTDTFTGGGGTDTLSFAGRTIAQTIHLDTSTATDTSGNTTSFSGISRYVGSDNGDTIYGSASSDNVLGGSGNNLFYASLGSDTLNGGSGGSNTISFELATIASTINLSTGVTTGYATDTLSNFSRVIASSHGDTVTGSTGNNSITGGTGNDLFYVTAGNDVYVGGGGTDTLSFATMTVAQTLHLDTNSSSDAFGDTATFSGISRFVGSNSGDTIYGSAGNDSVLGGSGNNVFYVSLGSDALDGGVGGNNTVNFSLATSASVIDLTAGTTTGYATDTLSNFSKVVGSDYGDTITGTTGSDSIIGGSGDNFVYATTGSDTVNGGVGGTNTISFANATTSSTINLTTGATTGWATDTLSNFTHVIGSARGDTITGSASSDSISAGSGNDFLYATAGADTINGGGGTDTLSFAGMAIAQTVHLDTSTSSDIDGNSLFFSGITRFVGSNNGDTIHGSTGNDSVLGGSGDNLFYASLGSDTLDGGSGGSNTITFATATMASVINLTTGVTTGWATDTLSNFTRVVASSHGDTIYGSLGNDSITGGVGNDLFYVTIGNDSFVGGGGTDTLSYANLGGPITLHIDTLSSTDGFGDIDSFSGISIFVGTNHGDTIYGSTGNDSVLGGSGNNLFYASLGSDTLDGGAGGSNTINFINATAGSVINLTTGVTAGWATDTISNFTKVIGSNHGDTITGSAGSDSIVGGSGNNYIYATTGNDTLNGGVGGTNTLSFVNATAASNIDLTSGSSTGFATDSLSHFTIVIGSDYGDTIKGSTSSDNITGGTGADLFYTTAGSDIFMGGGGVDTLSFAAMTAAQTIHLDTNSSSDASGNSASFSDITSVIGSNRGDTIYGSTGNDSVLGGSGNNFFYASLGTDTLNGGAGGTNTVSFANATSAVTVYLTTGIATGWGNDTLINFSRVIGSNFDDTITGSSGNNTITGGEGNDLFYATSGTDAYMGGGGTDILSFANMGVSQTIHLDTATATDALGDVTTFSGISRFVGGNHDDTIYGSTGNDSFLGGAGNNLFYASLGSDTLNGGVGGTNTISFINATSASTINLTTGTTTGWATDTLSNFTKVLGSNHGDTIIGSAGNDSIAGGSGNNLIFATTGSDTLNGGVGGTNTLSFANATSASNIDLTTGLSSGWATDALSNFTRLIGSNFGDTLKGSTGNDSIVGGSSNNVIYVSLGSDTLDGGTGGTNTLNFSNATSASTINLTAGTTTGYATDTISHFQIVVGSNFGDTV
ncbi:MAG: calcium-binding protein, partial [Alphaproteobacteria bacterium]|nr:calcium-binding protein [Alphaproteobacteria bacterium]